MAPDRYRDAEDCPKSADLPAYVMGQLAPEVAFELADHIDGCAHCREELADFRQVVDALAAPPVPPGAPRPDVAERVFGALTGFVLYPFRQLGPAGCRWLGMAVAGVILLLLVRTRARDAGESPPPIVAWNAAVTWLQDAQEADGTWSPSRWGGEERFRIGLTGLALAALSVAETRDADVAATLDRAARALCREQDSSGRLGPRMPEDLYNHAPATLGLLHLHARHAFSAHEGVIDGALRYLVARQAEDGGWGYSGPFAGRPNTVISAWPLEALERAHDLGFPDLHGAIGKGRRWFATMAGQDGRFGYERPGVFPHGAGTTTAIGIRFGLHPGRTDPASPADIRPGALDLMALYFRAPRACPSLRRQILDRVAGLQVRHGSLRGSFRPADRWNAEGGRLYATTVALLCCARLARD